MSGDLVTELAQAIAPGLPLEQGRGQAAVSRDGEILAEMLKRGEAETRLRLWAGEQSLVTTRASSRMAGFAKACARSAAAGWPVHVRSSGGTTVVHRKGVLNVSLFRANAHAGFDADAAYAELLDLLTAVLGQFGVHAQAGFVEGSYCDGRFNLCINGRKLAGTACQARLGTKGYVQLAHASLVVQGDIANDLAAITRFERALGIARDYDPAAHTSVKEALCGLLPSPQLVALAEQHLHDRVRLERRKVSPHLA